jgi:hypothetical protein
MRGAGRRAQLGAAAFAVVVAMAVAVAGCEGRCGKIDQSVVIASPDSELQALIDPCVARTPAPGETCPPSGSTAYPAIQCGCLPLCRRVLEIIDQFPGPESIEDCHYSQAQPSAADAGAGLPVSTVRITYRPSSCP